ncbi:hypothetical protein ACET3Z_031890 [Daucus carota]
MNPCGLKMASSFSAVTVVYTRTTREKGVTRVPVNFTLRRVSTLKLGSSGRLKAPRLQHGFGCLSASEANKPAGKCMIPESS